MYYMCVCLMHILIYIYIHMYIHNIVNLYIYIYKERERIYQSPICFNALLLGPRGH